MNAGGDINNNINSSANQNTTVKPPYARFVLFGSLSIFSSDVFASFIRLDVGSGSRASRRLPWQSASFARRMPPKGARLQKLAAFEAWAVEQAGVLAERARTRQAERDDPIVQLLNVLRPKNTAERQYYDLLKELQSGRRRAMDAEELAAAKCIWNTVSLHHFLQSSDGSSDSAGVPARVEEPASASPGASGDNEADAFSRLSKYGDWRKASSSRLRSALGMFAPDAEAPRSAVLQACEKLCDSQRPAELGDPELSGVGHGLIEEKPALPQGRRGFATPQRQARPTMGPRLHPNPDAPLQSSRKAAADSRLPKGKPALPWACDCTPIQPAPRNLRLRYKQSVAIRAGGDVECAEAPAPGLPLPPGSPPAPQTGPHSSRIALVVDVGVLLGLAGRLRVLIDDRSAWG